MTRGEAVVRLGRMRRRMKGGGATGWLVTDPTNVRWAAGVRDARWALVTTRTAEILPFGLGVTQVREDAVLPWRVFAPAAGARPLQAALGRAQVARLAFEAGTLSAVATGRLRAELKDRAVLVAADGWIEDLRATKDTGEVALLREAGRIVGEVAAQVPWILRAGITEAALAGELDARMRLAGAEGPAFETIVLFGARTALPHGRPGPRPLWTGDLVLADFGAAVDGYRSDLTRVWAFGRARPDDARRYRRVFAAYRAGRRVVRAGAKASAADAAARRALGRDERLFVHSLGHGVGLVIHERPTLSRPSRDRLASGMVVTVEPGIYRPGRGGFRLEDTMLVTRGQPVSLTGAPAPELPVIKEGNTR